MFLQNIRLLILNSVLLVCFLISFNLFAVSIKDKDFGMLQVANVTSIYDGDTFRANIQGVHPFLGEHISIRVSGIDTPEIRGKCEKEKVLARKAKQVSVLFLHHSKVIELRNIKRGKYFRIIADVYGDNKRLADTLLTSGLAVPYHGGKKVKNWCK